MKKLILCAMLLGICGAAAAQTEICLGKKPVTAAQTFFKKHSNFYYANPKSLSGALAPPLASALQRNYDCTRKEGGICALDADPWTNAQDGEPISKPRFGIQTTVGELQATVSMDYLFKLDAKSKGKPQSVKLQLSRRDVKSCWMVEDFIGPDGQSLIRQIKIGLES